MKAIQAGGAEGRGRGGGETEEGSETKRSNLSPLNAVTCKTRASLSSSLPFDCKNLAALVEIRAMLLGFSDLTPVSRELTRSRLVMVRGSRSLKCGRLLN